MDIKKELTKNLISSSLKELMLTQSFDKITIRMITERAGVIRPTFYYHFQDKYEVLEWIVSNEALGSVQALMDKHMTYEAIKMIFATIFEDRRFYARAFDIEGQNGFTGIFVNEVYKILIILMEKRKFNHAKEIRSLPQNLLAKLWAMNFVNIMQLWLQNDCSELSIDELTDSYIYLIKNPITTFFTDSET